MRAILILLLVVFAAFHASHFVHHAPFWDEAVYVGIGEYFGSFGEEGLYEGFRPVLLPVALGIGHAVGLDAYFFGKGLIFVVSLIGLWLFYRLARTYMKTRIAFLMTLFLAFTPLYFSYSLRVMTGLVALCFLLGGLLLYRKERFFLAGLLLGLAFITRFPAGMFGLFVVLALLFSRRFLALRNVLGGLVIGFIPYVLVHALIGDGLVAPFLAAATHQSNAFFSGSPLLYVGLVLSMPVLLFFVFSLPKAWREGKLLLAFAIIPLLYFSSIVIKQERFALLFFPFFLLLAGVGVERSLERVYYHHFWRGLVVVLLVACFIVQVLAVPFQAQNVAVDGDLITRLQAANGKILTTTPYPVLYTTQLYEPAYYDMYQGYVAYVISNASLFLYSKDSFPCHVYEHPERCSFVQAQLDAFLAEDEVVYAGMLHGNEVILYQH